MIEKLFEDIRKNLKEFDEKYDKDAELARRALLHEKAREVGFPNLTQEEKSKWITDRLKVFKGIYPLDDDPNLYTKAKRLFKKINPAENEKKPNPNGKAKEKNNDEPIMN